MTDKDQYGSVDAGAARLVRPYVITNGRVLPQDGQFALTTLVTAAEDHHQRPTQMSPEAARLVEVCSGGYLSVAEIAAHIRLPMGVVKILLSDLAERGFLITRPPVPRAELVDTEFLQELRDALKAHFSG